MEYFLLDYLGLVPEGIFEKLRESLDAHEDLVRQLTRRNERLQARVQRGSCCTQAGSPAANARSPASTARSPASTSSAEKKEKTRAAWRRELRSQVASKLAAAQETMLRAGAEAHHAAMKARLERTCRAARERIAAMSRRAELDERECEAGSAAAQKERERLGAALEDLLQQQGKARENLTSLEGDIRALDARCRTGEKTRRAYLTELESLRSELYNHKVRAKRGQAVEKRVRDLERELQATTNAISELQSGGGRPQPAPAGLGGA